MARFLRHARGSLLSHSLQSSSRPTSVLPPSSAFSHWLTPSSTRSYISEMRRSAFQENLLRILSTEIGYELEIRPPQEAVKFFKYFEIDDRPGKQWITLKTKFGQEDIKVDVTTFDYAVPMPVESRIKESEGQNMRLHISLIVDVRKGVGNDDVLQFLCSAWPDALEIQHVRVIKDNGTVSLPFMGPAFKDLDEEFRRTMLDFLEERSVDAELAVFLHQYMMYKDRREFVRWMEKVKSYVEK
ncbi:uncharacterized protein At2g39795, mitochondrial-like [Wolffia australiana]